MVLAFQQNWSFVLRSEHVWHHFHGYCKNNSNSSHFLVQYTPWRLFMVYRAVDRSQESYISLSLLRKAYLPHPAPVKHQLRQWPWEPRSPAILGVVVDHPRLCGWGWVASDPFFPWVFGCGLKKTLVEGFPTWKSNHLFELETQRWARFLARSSNSKIRWHLCQIRCLKVGWPWIWRHPAPVKGTKSTNFSAEKGGHWTCATCGGHVYRSCRERGWWVEAVGRVVSLLGWRFGEILPKWLKLV